MWLNSGDRLSGEILLLNGGKLALKSNYACAVLINWQGIATLHSDRPLRVRRQGFASEHSKPLAAAGNGMVRVFHDDSQLVAFASINA